MTNDAPDTESLRLDFRASAGASWTRFWLLLAVFGYFAYTVWFKDDISDLPIGLMMPAYVVPLVFAAAAIITAITIQTRLNVVTLDGRGMTLEFATREQHIPWKKIGGALGQHDQSGSLKLLWVFDHDGKMLFFVNDTLDNFEACHQRIIHQIRLYTMEDLPEVYFQRDRAGAAKSTLWITLVVMGLVASGWMGWEMYDRPLRLDREGIEGTAEVTEVFIDPEDNDQRVRYQVIDSKEPRVVVTTTLDDANRDRYRVGDEAQVLYMHHDPRHSRLEGQVVAPKYAPLLASLPVVLLLLVVLGYLIKLELYRRGRQPALPTLEMNQKAIDRSTASK